MKLVRAADLGALISAVRRDLAPSSPRLVGGGGPRTLYLIAATSHLAEGWRDSVPRLELAGAPVLEAAVRKAGESLRVELIWESPADVIPLPAGAERRARPAPLEGGGSGELLDVLHFDPYSVVLRLIARGDEMDYVDSLEYIRSGWVDFGTLEAMLADVLPRFTNETLAQDPAEFRRKFRGLRQLHRSEVAHRHLA